MSSGIGNTIICRYEKSGEKFEILVDPKLSYAYKTGANTDFSKVLSFEEIFKDANKGERQTEKAIKKAFSTTDVFQVAKQIFSLGELQLTVEQRRKIIEEKRRKLIELIARNCIDPRTKAPHPALRIENALNEARYSIDAYESVESQLEKAIDSIREIIPISMEMVRIKVSIPAQYTSHSFNLLNEFGMKNPTWQNDGTLTAELSMPAGASIIFYDKLNRMTSGNATTSLIA